MIKNYFKIAWRNLKKYKAFSFINIFGLTIGFACCLLISSFLYDELSYEKDTPHSRDIYRVELNVENKDFYAAADLGVGPGIKANFPEVISYARLSKWGNVFLRHGENQFKEDAIAMVDSNFLSLFSIPLLHGDAATVLNTPNSMVISEAAAIKYFGTTNALGKTIEVAGNKERPFLITGILANPTTNRHFNFDIYALATTPARVTWSNVGTYTYIRLKPGTDAEKLAAKFPQLVSKYVVPEVQSDMGVSMAEAQKSVGTFIFYLKPIKDIHLHSDVSMELQANGSIKYVYIFSALAFFILLLACVNFTNLSTAVSIKRSKEVGIRKVLGSDKKQLVGQFLAESSLLSIIAFVIALAAVYLLLPSFNQLAGKNIHMGFFLHPFTLVTSLVFVLIAGGLAGLYPAFFLSSFSIINILKGKGNIKQQSNVSLRSSLVVFQFAVSITLIISTVIVFQQLRFMQNKSLGFDTDQTLVINDTYLLGKDAGAFREQLLQDSRVKYATLTSTVPVNSPGFEGTQAFMKSADGAHNEIHIDKFHVDYDYLNTLGMKIKRGRAFSLQFPTDSGAVILNETAVKEFGFGDADPIGKTIVMSGQHEYNIVGVVNDFHYKSIKDKISPMIMMLGKNNNAIMVKLNTTAVNDFISKAKSDWKSFNASGPFTFSFLDERFANVYAAEERTGKVFSVFATISIIIAALGLFGLSAFTTEQRTKEVGIRKVLGASVQQVVLLLSKEFLVMVLIAFLIAVPVTWLAMHSWLQEFAYRINISWYSFLFAGIISVAIALFTVSLQAIKAAVANPIKSLRSQ